MWALKGRSASTGRTAQRAGYFDLCQPLLTDLRRGKSDHGFARLAGRYQGRLFDLQAVPDALTYRKLPCLWLMVTLTEPMPVTATLDVMMRPAGAEVFSRFSTLPVHISLPDGFPPEAALRSDSTTDLPAADLISLGRDLFAEPRVKELVISPNGLRIVWLAEEADRTRYLIFRDSELGAQPLAAEVLRPHLDRLVALATDLHKSLPAEVA